jgi:hypothetical protein
MFYGMDMSYDNMYNKFYGTARVTSLLHLSTFFLKSMIQHRRALDTSWRGPCGCAVQSKKIRGMESLVEKHQELVKHMRLYEKFLRWAKKWSVRTLCSSLHGCS